MQKTLSTLLIICLIAVLSAACAKRATPAGGEDEVTEIVQDLMERGSEVFWWYMGDNDSLASGLQVNSGGDSNIKLVGRFQTIAELKAATEEVFSRRFCEAILYPRGFNEFQGDNIKFREIEGRLYTNTNNGGMGWNLVLTEQLTVKTNEPEEIVVTMVCNSYDDGAITEIPVDFTFIKEDSRWKLDTWFDYGTVKVWS